MGDLLDDIPPLNDADAGGSMSASELEEWWGRADDAAREAIFRAAVGHGLAVPPPVVGRGYFRGGRIRRAPDLVVTLPGPPRGKGRPRTRVVPGKDGGPGFAHVYTDAETRNYEAMLRYLAQEAMVGRPLLEGPLRVRVNALFAVPGSWSNKKRQDCLRGIIRPCGKPDADNLLKCIDGLNGVVWKDDSAVVDARVVKAYSDKPMFQIEIWTRRGVVL